MKTAISLPDTLFEAAETFAQENGLSRSELYARALQLYLQMKRYQGVSETLDQIYGEESSALTPDVAKAQAGILLKEDW
jgi:metal-responsive CopG/Arc/MetJ family transcriptional regulator